MTTNDRIDAGVFQFVKTHGQNFCSSSTIGYNLKYFVNDLPNSNKNEPLHWWHAELANRSCQRLRKKGMLCYNSKLGWLLVP